MQCSRRTAIGSCRLLRTIHVVLLGMPVRVYFRQDETGTDGKGWYKGWQSAGAAISFGINAVEIPYIAE